MSENSSFDYSFPPPEKPALKTWLKHIALLVVTFFTAMIAGVLEPFGPLRVFPQLSLETWGEVAYFFSTLQVAYIKLIVSTVGFLLTDPYVFGYGMKFSLSMLFILTCHEAGHYIACRIYGVDTTLPYFLPMPPLIGPAGTLGAFIRIKSPLPSRRATFDIGVAGPIAGFIALIPISMIAFLTMETVSVPAGFTPPAGSIYFSDALFTQLMAWIFGRDLSAAIAYNPFYFASWFGLLVTSLNLIPSGQLDGGHAVFSVFGERVHFWTGRVAFFVMIAFSGLGLWFFGSPSTLLFTVLLGFMMRVRHPEPIDDTPLDLKRNLIAFITLVIFILCFTPFPIQIR